MSELQRTVMDTIKTSDKMFCLEKENERLRMTCEQFRTYLKDAGRQEEFVEWLFKSEESAQ